MKVMKLGCQGVGHERGVRGWRREARFLHKRLATIRACTLGTRVQTRMLVFGVSGGPSGYKLGSPGPRDQGVGGQNDYEKTPRGDEEIKKGGGHCPGPAASNSTALIS